MKPLVIHSIEFTPLAEKQFLKLERLMQERIKNSLERAKSNPFIYFFKLSGVDFYRMRVGDYRVIADIDQGKLLILVVKVGKRENVYD